MRKYALFCKVLCKRRVIDLMIPYYDKDYHCPIEYTLNLIGGKWKLLILYHLMNDKIKRYGELKRSVVGITHKMLAQQLKELEADGLVVRNEYHQIPPKVEYSLSERGITLLPVLGSLYKWGKKNMKGNVSSDADIG